MSQFTLLKKKRFGPFFWTQFLGAFNDNLFKNALLIMFAFHGASQLTGEGSAVDASTLVNLSAGLFILPFFLFSALAGQLADKFEKGQLIRWIKFCEIVLMSIAAVGFVFHMPVLLMALLFLMGTQSAFFGPVKYSILPQHLREDELVGGNGMVEMGTFLAILLGTIAGGILIALNRGEILIGAGIIFIAVIGWVVSKGIPRAQAADTNLKMNFNPITETWKAVSFTRQNIVVFRAILGISWFWFYGAVFLAQMPTFTEKVLHADEHVVTLLLTLFSIGIGVGSLMCEKLSHKRVELGLVPFGAIGLTLFAFDIGWTSSSLAIQGQMGITGFLSSFASWHMMLDLLAIGLFGGFYIVPLYALIQQRSPEESRSRVIAGNNILNALFMVLAAIMAIILLGKGFTIPQLFLIVSLLNALVAIYIFLLVPEFLLRFMVWILVHLFYRIRITGQEHLPADGSAVFVSNHISFVDFALISGVCPRPIRFVIDSNMFQKPLLHFFFKAGKTIPIAPAKQAPEIYRDAMDSIHETLLDGGLVGLFPEGQITETGDLKPFHSGIERIVETSKVPVIPIALKVLNAGRVDPKSIKAKPKTPIRFGARVEVEILAPLSPDQVTAEKLHFLLNQSLEKGNC